MEERETTTLVDAGADAVGQMARESEVLAHKERFGGRTEAQILSREPITVQLGGVKYEIRPAVIRVHRAYSQLRVAAMIDALKTQKITTDNPEEFATGFAKIIGGGEQLDMIFAYASEVAPDRAIKTYLPREVIEDTATAEEIALAFEEVVKLAEAPLARARATVKE